MSDDLVTQLKEQAFSDHVRGCEGRQYSCDCGYDIRTEGLLEQAATALSEARAEIERQADWIRRLQTALMFWMPGVDIRLDDATRELAADDAKLLAGHSGPLDCSCWGDEILARALAAESELSILRARVREVVGPFAKAGELLGPRLSDEYDQCIYSPAAGDEYSLCGDHLRAARQLMEEVK